MKAVHIQLSVHVVAQAWCPHGGACDRLERPLQQAEEAYHGFGQNMQDLQIFSKAMSFEDRAGVVASSTTWGRWWQSMDDVQIEVVVPEGMFIRQCCAML